MGSSTSLIHLTRITLPDNLSPYTTSKPSIFCINKCSTVNINTADICYIVNGSFSAYWLWMIPIMVALLLISLTISWTISSLSVYLRDFEQLMPPAISILMFMSAIFYPVKSLPASASFLVWINPLALLIEQTRIAIVLSKPPDALTLMVICIVATISAEMSYRFSEIIERFSDVI